MVFCLIRDDSNSGVTKKVFRVSNEVQHLSRPMGKPTICIGKNKDADQLLGNREADQRLCFRDPDNTIPPLLNLKISSFYPASVTVQAGLCRTWSETTLLVFPRDGSFINWCFRLIA